MNRTTELSVSVAQRRCAFLFLAILLHAGCRPAPAPTHAYQPPQQTADGLTTGTLAGANIDTAAYARAVDEIEAGRYGEIHALLVYRDGRLVAETYFPGHDYEWGAPGFHGRWVRWGAGTPHNTHSVTKSITSAVVGMAVDQGYIDSVEQSIFDYLPAYRQFAGGGKEAITIEQLLTMTAGLAWDEWGSGYDAAENDIIRLWLACDDPIACILEAPLVDEPGETFTYSGGNMILLGEIIRDATGRDIEAFAAEQLFAPLGIEPPTWQRFDNGIVDASADIYLTPRDMLKVGVLYLNDGRWQGEQLLPAAWVARSATPYDGPERSWLNHPLRAIPPGDTTFGRRGYGYTWWDHRYEDGGREVNGYYAFGFGGQTIIVLPELDAVVVLTGGNYSTEDYTQDILTDHLLPAISSQQVAGRSHTVSQEARPAQVVAI